MAKKTIIREMRGIPYFLLVEYLEEMGATEVEEGVLEAKDWTVKLERMEPYRIASISVGQTRVIVHIEEAAEEAFIAKFSMKTFRAGG